MMGISASINVDEFAVGCNGYLRQDVPYVVARAPARLDVMGGIADYTGSLVLETTLSHGVLVAAQHREDQQIHIVTTNLSGTSGPLDIAFPLSTLYVGDNQLCSPDHLASYLDEHGSYWAKYFAGVLYAMLQAGHLRHLGGGITLVVQSDIPPGVGIASSAAIEVATYRAVAALFEIELEPLAASRVCQTAENLIAGAPCGIMDQVTAFLGEPGKLLQLKCQPHQILGHLKLPAGVAVLGIDSCVTHTIREAKYTDTRVAAAMGHRFIVNLLNRAGREGDPTNGYLANITPTDFVDHFRDRIPTKIKGKQFLDWFGSCLAPNLCVDPDKIYKVRSRAEHHIYENARVHQFVERISRATRTGERDALAEAGQLMYASHWSYSQRCGLGTVETDVLVNLVRRRGINAGLYGAKVTAGGAGGTVAVLLNDSDDARHAIDEVIDQYRDKIGKQAPIYAGSSPGAMAFEPRWFNS